MSQNNVRIFVKNKFYLSPPSECVKHHLLVEISTKDSCLSESQFVFCTLDTRALGSESTGRKLRVPVSHVVANRCASVGVSNWTLHQLYAVRRVKVENNITELKL